MRRFVFVILLAILPIQFSWAAVTGYCRHETGSAANHFGHHQHQHPTSAADDASKNTKASGSIAGADLDCGICHLSAAQTLLHSTSDATPQQSDSPRFEYRWRYDSYIASGPERPDRYVTTPAVRYGGAVVTRPLLLA